MISRAPAAVLVAAGAASGAALRWGIAEVVDVGWLPWPTLIANVIGSAMLGYLLGRARMHAPPVWATAGVCSGLTTMSGFAVQMALLLDVALYGRALTYLLLTLILGIGSYRLAAQ